MTRVRLDIPSSFIYETEMELRISDINYGGHLGNDAVLSLVHESRVRFLASLGYSELDIEGAGIIMSDAVIVFRGEGFYGDTVVIRIAAAPPEGTRFDLFYLLSNKQTGKEIAKVKTGLACFDYSTRRAVPVPLAFIQHLGFS